MAKILCYGRKSGKPDERIALDFDHVVFDLGRRKTVVVSLFRARRDGVVEVMVEEGGHILVRPKVANVIEVAVDTER